MHLFDLPPELLEAIIAQTVHTLGLQRSLRARLVCKRFSEELVSNICNTDLVITFRYRHRRYPTFFLHEYLKRRTLRNPNDPHPLFVAINRYAEFLEDRGRARDRVSGVTEACRFMLQCSPHDDIASNATSSADNVRKELEQDEEARGLRVLAAWIGDLEYLRDTAKRVEFPNAVSGFGGCPGDAAAMQKHIDILVYLFGDNDYKDDGVESALEAGAGFAGHKEIARMFFDDYSFRYRDVSVVVQNAAEYGHLELLQYVLFRSQRHESHYDEHVDSFRAAVYHACVGGQVEVLRCFLPHLRFERGESWDNEYGDSCLSVACRRGHANIVSILLPFVKTNAKAVSPNGRRIEDPLAQTGRRGHIPIIRLLLQHGMPVDGTSSTDGYSTPLCRAVEHGQYAAAEFLLDHGANIKGRIGAHIMTKAIESGEESMVKLLAERGCDINQGFYEDKPPIVVAATEKQWDIERLLEQLGGKKPLAPLPPDTKVYSTICP